MDGQYIKKVQFSMGRKIKCAGQTHTQTDTQTHGREWSYRSILILTKHINFDETHKFFQLVILFRRFSASIGKGHMASLFVTFICSHHGVLYFKSKPWPYFVGGIFSRTIFELFSNFFSKSFKKGFVHKGPCWWWCCLSITDANPSERPALLVFKCLSFQRCKIKD